MLESLHYLNHPLREAQARQFVRPALDLLPEIQKTGDIFFPKRWMDATLSGQRSPEAAATVRQFLAAASGVAAAAALGGAEFSRRPVPGSGGVP